MVPAEKWVVVSNVKPAVVANRAGAVEDLVDPVTGTINPLAFVFLIEEVVPLDVSRCINPAKREYGRREVDEGNQFIIFAAVIFGPGDEVLPFFRYSNHEGYSHP